MTKLEALENLRLLGPRILVQKVDRDAGAIILPDEVKQETGFCRIILVGEACQHFTQHHVDGFVHLPIQHNGIRRYGDNTWGYAIVTEDAAMVSQDFGVYWMDEV
jgi:hypothetical protein